MNFYTFPKPQGPDKEPQMIRVRKEKETFSQMHPVTCHFCVPLGDSHTDRA